MNTSVEPHDLLIGIGNLHHRPLVIKFNNNNI